MIAGVLFVINLHIATDTINKLPIPLFENVIVFIWGQNLSRSTGRKFDCVANQKIAFCVGIFRCRNHDKNEVIVLTMNCVTLFSNEPIEYSFVYGLT